MIHIKKKLLQWFINFSDKNTSGSGIKNGNISNKHNAVIRKLYKRKVQSHFIDKMWGADLAYMQLIRKLNKGFRLLLCVIDIYSKYTWVFP